MTYLIVLGLCHLAIVGVVK